MVSRAAGAGEAAAILVEWELAKSTNVRDAGSGFPSFTRFLMPLLQPTAPALPGPFLSRGYTPALVSKYFSVTVTESRPPRVSRNVMRRYVAQKLLRRSPDHLTRRRRDRPRKHWRTSSIRSLLIMCVITDSQVRRKRKPQCPRRSINRRLGEKTRQFGSPEGK
jgi:hypothetical protein